MSLLVAHTFVFDRLRTARTRGRGAADRSVLAPRRTYSRGAPHSRLGSLTPAAAAPMTSVTTNDGVSLACYERHGQPVGPVVLLIHGWSGSRQYFAPVIGLLGGSCQVITVDLRHHGDSDRPAHGFHVARFAADLNDLITALDLKDVFVVGTSMGAAVIWSYIELYRTSRLAGAVFVDQAPLQNTAEDWKLGSKGCYDAASLAVLQLKLTMDPKGFAHGNVDCCASKEIAPATQEVLINESLRCDPVALGKIMADHTQLDWRPILPTIDIPCLNLVGRLSGVFPWEGCAAVGQMIPDCKTVFFEDCNHWLYLEEPQKFADLLVKFTNSHTRQNIVHESSA